MKEYVELISVPAIASVVYAIIEIIKHAVGGNEKFKKFIPLMSAVLGAAIGISCYYLMPNIIPANNELMAILIGGASGLSATGANQIFKQLNK